MSVLDTALDAAFPDTPACSCADCQSMCHRPCWPTPSEAHALMDAGLSNRLRLDYWIEDDGSQRYILGPALLGGEGDEAPFWPTGHGAVSCTFQDKDGLCSLHARGLKPAEGRKALCYTSEKKRRARGKDKFDGLGLHKAVADTWASDEGRAAVARWRALGYPCPLTTTPGHSAQGDAAEENTAP